MFWSVLALTSLSHRDWNESGKSMGEQTVEATGVVSIVGSGAAPRSLII